MRSDFLCSLRNVIRLLSYLNSVHDWHLGIHENDFVGAAALIVSPLLDHFHRLLSVSRLVTFDAELVLEDVLQNVPVHIDVVYEQHLRATAGR